MRGRKTVFYRLAACETALNKKQPDFAALNGFTVFADANAAQPFMEFDFGESNSIGKIRLFLIKCC
ncbi:hypothetical protein HGO97_010915 [Faecalicatena sp. AGMB00832]|uniref:F5/8 type C domain-containing protein n=1 Tax=Faecalicatena faecalis TaxID=2726362 RepID=A0ABS6D415_9FIRM|nr:MULTISPECIES: hypothetical protein [Faecalicatena]MBU3876324.1 hypothetical protein [Faecalicatena faecalis]MDY5618414.1 hypothetical protein [Lachnospiraceae bacterium]